MAVERSDDLRRILFYGLFIGSRNPYSLDSYSQNCLHALSTMPDVEIIVLSPVSSQIKQDSTVKVLSVPKWLKPKWGAQGMLRIMWASVAIPLLMKRTGATEFFSPVAEGPLFKFGNYSSSLTIHDVIPVMDRPYSLSGIYYRLILKIMTFTYDNYFTISQSSKADIVALYGKHILNRIQVIPSGTDLSLFSKANEDVVSKNYVLYVGNFLKYKNVETIVRSLLYVSSDVYLLVIGSLGEWQKEGLEQLSQELGVRARITLKQDVTINELVDSYQHALALIHLAKYEGFGLTLVEAMASGCPVIYAHRSALIETVGQSGIPVTGDDPVEVANAIMALLDPAVRADFARMGKMRSLTFTLDSFVSNFRYIMSNYRNSN